MKGCQKDAIPFMKTGPDTGPVPVKAAEAALFPVTGLR
ncbi:hypothetical protein LHK_01611 [Laribacter hongkongensis HLHK9]|uniref:Uncharacterized protein n=1 Tax=Laribacter hongkongensis (strain HLHK9) TaxID=557598 RepID=C1D807_LARHH|nr:hypothetical protein LHK_01611 [Laribacter hongkongensis HLHK9]